MPAVDESDTQISTIHPAGLKTTLNRADEANRLALEALSHEQERRLPEELCKHSLSTLRLRPTTSSYLRAGLEFAGTQQSGRAVYEVNVTLQYVDLLDSFLCGFLRIAGLSEDHPTLTTYFEGEIIGNKYSFITKNPGWGSSEKIDIEHWARFAAFRPIAQSLRHTRAAQKTNTQEAGPHALDHVFMRWKELQILPNEPESEEGANGAVNPSQQFRDMRTRNLEGVSFAGFYYICLDQRSGTITGMYFHAHSELYQQLSLSPQKDRQFESFEWR